MSKLEFELDFEFNFVLDFELRFENTENVLTCLQVILNLLLDGSFIFTDIKHMISFLKPFDK